MSWMDPKASGNGAYSLKKSCYLKPEELKKRIQMMTKIGKIVGANNCAVGNGVTVEVDDHHSVKVNTVVYGETAGLEFHLLKFMLSNDAYLCIIKEYFPIRCDTTLYWGSRDNVHSVKELLTLILENGCINILRYVAVYLCDRTDLFFSGDKRYTGSEMILWMLFTCAVRIDARTELVGVLLDMLHFSHIDITQPLYNFTGNYVRQNIIQKILTHATYGKMSDMNLRNSILIFETLKRQDFVNGVKRANQKSYLLMAADNKIDPVLVLALVRCMDTCGYKDYPMHSELLFFPMTKMSTDYALFMAYTNIFGKERVCSLLHTRPIHIPHNFRRTVISLVPYIMRMALVPSDRDDVFLVLDEFTDNQVMTTNITSKRSILHFDYPLDDIDTETAQLLVDYVLKRVGKRAISICDTRGYNCIHSVPIDILEYLMDICDPGDLTAVSHIGTTPLHNVCERIHEYSRDMNRSTLTEERLNKSVSAARRYSVMTRYELAFVCDVNQKSPMSILTDATTSGHLHIPPGEILLPMTKGAM